MSKARKVSKAISEDYAKNLKLKQELEELLKSTEDLKDYELLELLYDKLKRYREHDKKKLKESLRKNS